MTRARIESVPKDPGKARALIEKAGGHLGDARGTELGDASRYLLAYQACLDAMTAAMAIAGKRVTSGAGGHIELARATAAALSDADATLDRIDVLRRQRHRIAYEGDDPTSAEVEEMVDAAESLVVLVRTRIAGAEQ